MILSMLHFVMCFQLRSEVIAALRRCCHLLNDIKLSAHVTL